MGAYYGTTASEIIDPLDTSNDYIFADAGNDIAYGWDGNDDIDGWTGNDTLYGEYGDDTLWGYEGDDSLIGGSGSDSLLGEAGYDYLDGYGYTSNEYDSLTGGSNADTFALGDSWETYYALDGEYSYYGDGYATITDYNYSEGDTIQLNYNASVSGYYSFDTSYDYNNNGLVDTSIYYGSNLIGVVSDTSYVAYNYV